MNTRFVGYIFIFVMNLILVEVGAYSSGEYYLRRKAAFLFCCYGDDKVLEQFDSYMIRRNEVLGWPPKDWKGHGSYDTSGSRVIPAFPTPGNACVSLYGDSFTFGAEVDDEHAWSNQLAKRLGCRVANYGVEAYGTDQALLYFQHNLDDEAPVVVLGIWAEDMVRILNQYRALVGGTSQGQIGLKPRFILDERGELELVPLPTLIKTQFATLLKTPATYLKRETFLPDTISGPVTWNFPYTWAVAKMLTHERVRAWLSGEPSWSPYYRPDHPSKGLALMTKIVEAFRQTAKARAKESLIIIFPTHSAVEEFRKTGSWAYQPLLDAAKGKGIRVHNLGPDILGYLGARRFCDILSYSAACTGHFNEEGYGVVADLVYHYIKTHKLL